MRPPSVLLGRKEQIETNVYKICDATERMQASRVSCWLWAFSS